MFGSEQNYSKWVVGVLCLLALGFMALSVGSHVRWVEDQFAGKVLSVEEGGFVMTDRALGEHRVQMSEATIVERGRHRLVDGVNPGDHVLVVGTKDERGVISANVVRIVDEIPW